jgi:hypothetical protein
MIKFERVNELLNKIPTFILKDSYKKDILKKSEIYFELREFIMNKYNIDEDGAESKFKEYYSDKVEKPTIKYLIDNIVEYSLIENFLKHDELVDNTKYIKKLLGNIINLYK